MSGPLRNHVESRSSREAARQFVSETHDHKPDAPGAAVVELPIGDLPAADFFNGTGFAVEEIVLGLNVLHAKVKHLKSHHAARSAVAMKLASEDVAKVAHQIEMLANVLTDTALRHINRRPRS